MNSGAACVVVANHDISRGRQNQGEGHVRRRAIQATGRIADRNVSIRRRREINVIDADSVVADDLQIRSEIQQQPVHVRMPVGDERLGSSQRIRTVRRLPRQHLKVVSQQFEEQRRKFVSHDRRASHAKVSGDVSQQKLPPIQ